MLNPTLLLASAINAEGCLELPIVEKALPFPAAAALFWPGEDGEFRQRITSVFASPLPVEVGADPLDMALLGRCLTSTFGALTPDLFRVEEGETGHVALVHEGASADQVRLRMLRDAFNVYLAAYEERLI